MICLSVNSWLCSGFHQSVDAAKTSAYTIQYRPYRLNAESHHHWTRWWFPEQLYMLEIGIEGFSLLPNGLTFRGDGWPRRAVHLRTPIPTCLWWMAAPHIYRWRVGQSIFFTGQETTCVRHSRWRFRYTEIGRRWLTPERLSTRWSLRASKGNLLDGSQEEIGNGWSAHLRLIHASCSVIHPLLDARRIMCTITDPMRSFNGVMILPRAV